MASVPYLFKQRNAHGKKVFFTLVYTVHFPFFFSLRDNVLETDGRKYGDIKQQQIGKIGESEMKETGKRKRNKIKMRQNKRK